MRVPAASATSRSIRSRVAERASEVARPPDAASNGDGAADRAGRARSSATPSADREQTTRSQTWPRALLAREDEQRA